MSSTVLNSFTEAHELLTKVLADSEFIAKVESATDLLTETIKNGNRVLSCGNGGSMCDSLHFAEEMTGRYSKDRKPLPAISLSDPAHMSCVANDFGYEFIFSRLVESWGSNGDLLLAISTSGNSPNVINAVKSAKDNGIKSIGLLGKSGGELASMVDVPIIVPSNNTGRIQEIHIKIVHILIEAMERKLFPEHYC